MRKIKTFKEFAAEDSEDLSEQAIAMKGDWNEGVDKISTMSETMTLKWELINNIKIPNLGKTYEFRKLRNSLEFVLGYWTIQKLKTKLGIEEKPVFETIFRIGLTRYKSVEKKLGHKKLINVDGVAVLKNYTNNGISTIIYKYLVNELNYTILGDKKQYFGARKLWARLSKDLDVKVDIIDIKKKELIHENIVLHHGNYDEDFDKALWDYTESKEHLRSVLTKII
jgi:hypothetical protein